MGMGLVGVAAGSGLVEVSEGEVVAGWSVAAALSAMVVRRVGMTEAAVAET